MKFQFTNNYIKIKTMELFMSFLKLSAKLIILPILLIVSLIHISLHILSLIEYVSYLFSEKVFWPIIDFYDSKP